MKISVRERASDGRCPLCGAPMVERRSRRGGTLPFLGCSRFPECTHTVDDSLGGDPDGGEQRAHDMQLRLLGRRESFSAPIDADDVHDEIGHFPYRDDWGW